MPRKGESKNQYKKRMDSSNINASIVVDTNVNWSENAIVFIDKNFGNCFSAKVVHTKNHSFKNDVKVAFARSFGAKTMFERSRSRLGLVTISTIKLSNGCTSMLEEIVTETHLKSYLKKGLLDKETYETLLGMIGVSDIDKATSDEGGYTFDRESEHKETSDKVSESGTSDDEEVDVEAI